MGQVLSGAGASGRVAQKGGSLRAGAAGAQGRLLPVRLQIAAALSLRLVFTLHTSVRTGARVQLPDQIVTPAFCSCVCAVMIRARFHITL